MVVSPRLVKLDGCGCRHKALLSSMVLALALGALLLLLQQTALFTSSKIDFAPSDLSLQKPVRNETLPTIVLIVLICIIVPSWAIGSILLLNRSASYAEIRRLFLCNLYTILIVSLLTEVLKSSFGKLRPTFITVCAPDLTKVEPGRAYVTAAEVCTTDVSKLFDLRKSFPSGHASTSSAAAVIAIAFLQERLDVTSSLKPLWQLPPLLLALWVGGTRYVDNKHDFVDIISGVVLGALLATFIYLALLRVAVLDPADVPASDDELEEIRINE